LQGFHDSSSSVDPAAPWALVPTTLALAASLGKSSTVSQLCHLCQCLRIWDLG
jgi:hypothetical protein